MHKRKPEISLILPLFNESEHFSESIVRILTVLETLEKPWEIIFVEDKSRDTTKALVEDFIETTKQKNISAIYHVTNKGRGQSVIDGINRARGEIVGFIDVDLEVGPHYIPSFIQAIEQGFDIACGWRHYVFSFGGILRWVISTSYRFVAQQLLRMPLNDTETGYKFFRRTAIMSLLKDVKNAHWFWDTEVMVLGYYKGLKIQEIPVVFTRRQDKSSTVQLIPDTIEYVQSILQFRQKLKRENYI